MNGKTVEKTEVERHSEARRKLMDKEASKHAPKFCLYMFRHSFTERLRQAGVDTLRLRSERYQQCDNLGIEATGVAGCVHEYHVPGFG